MNQDKIKEKTNEPVKTGQKKKKKFYGKRKPMAKAPSVDDVIAGIDLLKSAKKENERAEKSAKTDKNANNNVHFSKKKQGGEIKDKKSHAPTHANDLQKKEQKKPAPVSKSPLPKVGAKMQKPIPKKSVENFDAANANGASKKNEKGQKTSGKNSVLRICSLGGLAEIGKNMTMFEYGDDIVLIDAGLAFPDEEMLGIDLVIPDISYLVKNADKVRGILITHGHEDHIGAVPYILSQIDVPIYGTKLSLGIIEGKLEENMPAFKPRLYTVNAGDTVSLGSSFKAEFIHVNHSIADACAIALRTPVGLIYHSGDFKLDVSPLDGKIMDLTRIGELGKQGVDLLLCESTNAERPGFTPSERSVGSSLERIFTQYEDKRLIIATFSSNVHRVQQIIDTSAKHGRKVAVTGRSMVNVLGAAVELGYIELPENVLIDPADMKRYRPEEITVITTGSQGEPMSALYRIAFDEHSQVKLTPNDVVVLSSSAIPGNEKLIGRIINALVKNGVRVVNDSMEKVHVSGHACQEELKLLISLLKPKNFMPIHGEYRHLYANKDLAEFMGIPSNHIFISDIGRVLEMDRHGVRFAGSIPAGNVLVDGSGVGDIGNVVLRDRKHLSEDGLVVIVATVDFYGHQILSGPDIVSRGFVYVKEADALMDGARRVALKSLENSLSYPNIDFAELKNQLHDNISKYLSKETKRKPMILPVIMNI